MKNQMYLISYDLLAEVISGLVAYGQAATEETVEKLKNLEKITIEEEYKGIPDVDSV